MKEEQKKTISKKVLETYVENLTNFVCFLAIQETLENYNEMQKIGVKKFIEKTTKKCLEQLKEIHQELE